MINAIFYLIHYYVLGPYPHESTYGSSYFLTIVDDHFRATRVYLLIRVVLAIISNIFLSSSKPNSIEPLRGFAQIMV